MRPAKARCGVVQIIGDPKIPAEIEEFVRWLVKTLRVSDPVLVELVSGGLEGLCVPPRLRYYHIFARLDNSTDKTLDTLAHEFVHYEQGRDKRCMNEWGVKQRAAALVRRFKREAA